MLPYKQDKGRSALKRIKCWKGVPPQFEGKDFIKIGGAEVSKLPNYRYVTVHEIVKHLGGKLE
jgi:large subunit ribosomal protein L13